MKIKLLNLESDELRARTITGGALNGCEMSEADTSDHGMVEELLAGLLKTLDVSGNERVTHRAFSKVS